MLWQRMNNNKSYTDYRSRHGTSRLLKKLVKNKLLRQTEYQVRGDKAEIKQKGKSIHLLNEAKQIPRYSSP